MKRTLVEEIDGNDGSRSEQNGKTCKGWTVYRGGVEKYRHGAEDVTFSDYRQLKRHHPSSKATSFDLTSNLRS